MDRTEIARTVRLTAQLAFAGTLMACSSFEQRGDGGVPVPQPRIFQLGLLGQATASGDGTMTFERDWGYLGGGCNHVLFVDGSRAFEIAVNERITIHLAAGHHLLRIQDATWACPGTTTSLETDLLAGSEQLYRIQLTGGQAVNLARIR